MEGKYRDYIGVLDCDTLHIYRISKESGYQLEQQEASEEKIYELCGDAINHPVLQEEENKATEFDTLILHISNTCNMKCGYCFAGHGSYHTKPGIMSERTAIRTLELYYGRYQYIREIKFFGGEPALNLDVIASVGAYVEKLYEEGIIRKLPVYKIITNGTVMNDKFVDLVNKYQIKVVFSMDGQAAIHDEGRKFSDGRGSFSAVSDNFFYLKQHTDGKQPYSIDVTYSAIHEKHGESIYDVVCFLTDTFGLKPSNVNVSLINTDEDSGYMLKGKTRMLESAEDALRAAEEGDCRVHMKLHNVIRRLNRGGYEREHICMAAQKWSAVSYEGEVFPCLMFMERDDCYMGNVKGNLFDGDNYKEVEKTFDKKKLDNQVCSGCFANKVCVRCMGINEYETGDLCCSRVETCEETRKIVELAVRGIAEGVW